jgi:radical SAM protein with 4Fe4S-binding SPASM domain
MLPMNWRDGFLLLSPEVVLKRLESLFIYHLAHDELYEIDESGAAFLLRCNGTKTGLALSPDPEFADYCIEEGILHVSDTPADNPVLHMLDEQADPSLRYLELQLTSRCNLRCLHCYLDEPVNMVEMTVDQAVSVAVEFSQLGGLRLLISGGEPLLYRGLRSFLEAVSNLKVRRVLLTNGTLINPENLKWLNVHEIQFSLDGWETGHDHLRGEGSFKKTLSAIRAAQEAGYDISISTMIHQYNLDQFERLSAFVKDVNALEWGIDALCVAGRLTRNPDLLVDLKTCANMMGYGFGGGYHGSSEAYACGRHLMTVMPDGRAAKCGFYMNEPVGNVLTGVKGCWDNIKHIRLEELYCRDCSVVDDCRGGCRFRAGAADAPDPVMCTLYNRSG